MMIVIVVVAADRWRANGLSRVRSLPEVRAGLAELRATGGLMGVTRRLQTIPMHNYPTFLNLLTTFVYVRLPLSCCYCCGCCCD